MGSFVSGLGGGDCRWSKVNGLACASMSNQTRREHVSDKPAEAVDISIEFTEQQMELVQRLASETSKSPAEAVAVALEAFIRKEGHQYTR